MNWTDRMPPAVQQKLAERGVGPPPNTPHTRVKKLMRDLNSGAAGPEEVAVALQSMDDIPQEARDIAAQLPNARSRLERATMMARLYSAMPKEWWRQ